MAKIMNDEQRLTALEGYNPQEHLIAVGRDRQGKTTMYYPAAWRLYELSLRYPNANFSSKIIYHNENTGDVIIRARLYLGSSYKTSEKRAEAMKQGKFASLDKVETAAKARCARDFGVGTEYALDMEPDETDATHDPTPHQRQSSLQRPTTPPTSQQANHSPQPPQVTPAPSQAQQGPLVQEVATEKQVLSIRKLCEHLGKPEPEGLEAMSYASAKTLIEGLTQEYRQSRSQAQAPAPVPVQAQPTPDIAALQKLCHEVLGPGRWAYAKEKLLGKNLPDKDVTEAHRVVLYNRLMEHAARKQGNGSEAA